MTQLNQKIIDVLNKWKNNNNGNLYGEKNFNYIKSKIASDEYIIILRIKFKIHDETVEDIHFFHTFHQYDLNFIKGNCYELNETCEAFDNKFKKDIIDKINKILSD